MRSKESEIVNREVNTISKGGFMKRFKAQKAYLVFMSILTVFMILPGCSGGVFGGGSWNQPHPPIITAFSLNGTSGTVNDATKNITVTIPFGTSPNGQIATYTTTGTSVKVGTTVQVNGATANNFTNPLQYVVTGADNSTATYTVTVTVAPSFAKAITSYSLNGATGTINESITPKTIAVTVPFLTNPTALVATFTTTGQGVSVGGTNQVSGTTPNDFTAPVAYIVTAADGTTATYNVTVTVASNSAKAIAPYSLNGIPGVINESLTPKTIAVTMPFGTNPNGLIATFSSTGQGAPTVGGTNQVSGTTANNFTNPVSYLVTANDGSQATYVVTVTVASNSSKGIAPYSLNGIPGIINESLTPKTIAVTMPFGTNPNGLIATFTTTGQGVPTVGGTNQLSGTTTNNFTNPVSYLVTANDGTQSTYVVTVSVAANSAKAIAPYTLNGVPGIINESLTPKTIALTMPFGTNPNGLIATFTSNGQGVPTVGGTNQLSGATPNNFTNPLSYLVTAADGTTATYIVTVTVAANSAKAIAPYTLNGVPGIINESLSPKTIALTMPAGTNPNGLIATFTTTGQGAPRVAGTNQLSGTTPNDFTNPVSYVVTANDLTQSTYVVTVTVAANSAKAIAPYSLNGVPGTINESLSPKTIAVTMPFGTNPNGLIATFTTTGLGVPTVAGTNQLSGTTPNNFTNPVSYLVTATDGTTATYVVTVTVAANSAKAIAPYSLNGVQGVINESLTPKTIAVTMPTGTNRNGLIATFTSSGQGVPTVAGTNQLSGTTPNNFTTPVSYTVTAADSSTTTYIVTVTVSASSAKAIAPYSLNGVQGVINESLTPKTIAVTMPFGTNKNGLIATFTSTGQGVPTVAGINQLSGTTSNDFTNPVSYLVTATDGTTATYAVTVTVAANSAKTIAPYSLNGVSGIINEALTPKTISVAMPAGTNPNGLIATFTSTGQGVPTVTGTNQLSGTTPNNFTAPVSYLVTAADASTATYIVTVTVAVINNGPAGAPPILGTAATFGVIAWDAITNSAGPSHIYGDVALTKPSGVIAAVTGAGFNDTGVAPSLKSSIVTTSDGVHPGMVTASNNGTPTNIAALPQLLLDLRSAYDDLIGRAAPVTPLISVAAATGVSGGTFPAAAPDLSGYVLSPGIYTTTGTYGLSNTNGPLVLDAGGNADAVFIIRSTGSGISGLTSTTGSILLQNGAKSKNVYWVMDNLTVGSGTFFQGTAIVGHVITLNTFANVEGRMFAGALGLASGAITLSGTNIITVPQ